MTSKQVVTCSLFKETTSRVCHKDRAAATLLLSLLKMIIDGHLSTA